MLRKSFISKNEEKATQQRRKVEESSSALTRNGLDTLAYS